MNKQDNPGEGIKIIAVNKKARFNYEILETVEAGIVLTGAEIKSVRSGKVNIQEAFVRPQNGEIHLIQAHIAQYPYDKNPNYEPARKRKLLLHKSEIMRLQGRVEAKGLTVVPIKIYLKNGRAKLEVGLARGKAAPDKRQTIKDREGNREAQRAQKARRQ